MIPLKCARYEKFVSKPRASGDDPTLATLAVTIGT